MDGGGTVKPLTIPTRRVLDADFASPNPRVKNKNPGEGKPPSWRQRVIAVLCLDNPDLVIDRMRTFIVLKSSVGMPI
jgi:hypothetical protein